MSWYRRMVVAAFMESGEMSMFERWVEDLAMDISNAKNKLKLNKIDPNTHTLDKWFFGIIQAVKNIWTHFASGSPQRLESAISCANQVNTVMPKLERYFGADESQAIKDKLGMITETMGDIKSSLDKKKQQQDMWSKGTPPAQPQMVPPQPKAPAPIPQPVPAAGAFG